MARFVFVTRGDPSPLFPPERFGVAAYVVIFKENFELEGVMDLDDGREVGMFGSTLILGSADMDLSTDLGFSDFRSRLKVHSRSRAEDILAEQARAGQPATRFEPDSEGGEKPKPESDANSR